MNPRGMLRSLVYRFEKQAQRRRFASVPEPAAGWPILLGISFPKSGTHLLDQILLGFSRLAPFARRLHSFYAEYEGESGRRRPTGAAVEWLKSLRPLDVASAHLFARPQVVNIVGTPSFVPYFIFRDPRDVVVSHVFYITEMERRHVHHAYFASLPDFDARVRASILGRPELEIEFPNIAQRFEPYMGWFDRPEVLKIHFEDLVQDRARALAAVVDHFVDRTGVPLDRGAAAIALESSINPRRSPTFRSGKTGEWKKHFSPENRLLFKSVAGDLLQRLGYETDNSW
jgi:hypothetical protein